MSTLYVVATPIGNLSDISERALDVLGSVSFIACEDTRTSGILLSHYGIKKPTLAYHKFNEESKSEDIIDHMVRTGEDCAIITDAGTPGISDPGAVLVAKAYDAGITVTGVPGACACATAMSVSGFDGGFCFTAFLPRKRSEAEETVRSFEKSFVNNFVFYESPKRIVETLSTVADIYPDALVCVCNDMTKKFERIYRGNILDVLEDLKTNQKSDLGEYAVVLRIERANQVQSEEKLSVEAALLDRLLRGDDLKEAQAVLGDKYSRNELYDGALRLKKIVETENGKLKR